MRTPGPNPALTLALATALLTSAACSPYGYRPATTKFADSVTAVTTALTTNRQAVAEDRMALMRVDVADRRMQPVTTGSCTLMKSDPAHPCRVVPANASNDAVAERYLLKPNHEVPAAKIAELKILARYAKSLAALTEAKDREAFDAAAKQMADALQAWVGAAAPAASGAALVGPVARGALYLFGEALDYERYVQLRTAVSEADPHIAALQETIGEMLNSQRGALITLRGTTAETLARGVSAQATPEARIARLNQTFERAALAQAAREVDPDKVAAEMVKAHAALKKALDDPKTALTAAVATIERFAEQVETLRTAIDETNKK
jgi:hypothetical protein